ncbi:MAG: hypothetical protein PHH06_03060 [Candidatus Gracilibacteria bacterium]|nr:hypothetical protein [Candidatus Gracilibacteria bacterium]
MDFKAKFKTFKDKAVKLKDTVIEKSAESLMDSSFTITKIEDLNSIIKESAATTFVSKKTGETKMFKHRVVVVFGDEKSDFFKKALYMFPVLVTKAFSQNIKLKLATINIKELDLSTYGVKIIPSLVVFEEEKVLKIIEGEDNIFKLVKSANLDINKQIDNF